MKYVNCLPTDTLGYPGYYRAVYVRGRVDSAAQLEHVVGMKAGSLLYNGLVEPLNEPTPGPDDRVAILTLSVLNDRAGRVTVADLARQLDVSPVFLFSWFRNLWPDFLTAVHLEKLERVSSQDAYSPQALEAERQSENQAADNDALAKIKLLLLVLVVVAIAVAAIYAGGKAYRVLKR